MSDNNIQPTNQDANAEPQITACSTSGKCCNHGLMRAVLYTPIILGLGALAALATFPELANYATPLIGESTKGACSASADGSYQCPIAAMFGGAKAQSSPMAMSGGCCASKMMATSGGCCASRTSCCQDRVDEQSASESEPSNDLTEADPAPSITEDGPADATAAANALESDSPSN